MIIKEGFINDSINLYNVYTNIIIYPFYNLFPLFKHHNLIFFVHYGGLGMFKCRSPPFLSENSQSKETEDFKMKKEFYLYVNGQKVKVSEQIYIVYWREKEHEKYLEQVDKKNHLLFFSSLDHDGHFADNIA